MKKTIQIFIASTAFTCSEEAYTKLSSYIEKLKEHFRNDANHEEIIQDIESRIAEKLLEQGHPFVSAEDVSTILAEIGDVSEIDETEASEDTERPQRRLYRDTDNALIAGVAGGIAAYFDIPALFVRLLFLVSLLFGGTGLFLYIILWVLIPEAKTAAQRLQMHGKAVTFQSISDTVRSRISQSERTGFVRRFVNFVHVFVAKVLQFSAKLLGVLITVGSFVAIIGLTVFMGIILTNWNAPYNDFPFRDASSTLLLVTALVSGFFAAVIPLLFIFALGYRLVRNRVIIPAVLGFALIGVWSLAVVSAGVSGTKIAGDFYTHLQTDPQYEVVTQTHAIEPVERIVATNARLLMKQGETYEVVVEGQTRDLERIMFDATEGTLTIKVHDLENCIFCGGHSNPTVTVTVPDIASIEVNSGSFTFDSYTGDNIQVTADEASIRGSLEAAELTVAASHSSFRTDLTVQNLTLNASETSLRLAGLAATADLTLQDATLYAGALVIQDATLNASESYAELDVRGTFEQSMNDDSIIDLKQYTPSTR